VTEVKNFRGLSVYYNEDGMWLRFKPDTGLDCSLNLSIMAEQKGNIIGDAIRDWCVQTAIENVGEAKP
jgi:hypothetical protein